MAEIEYFASLFFSQEEILQIIRPSKTLTPFELSLLKGQLKGEAQLRQSLLTAAANGSSPAQTHLLKLRDKQKLTALLKEID